MYCMGVSAISVMSYLDTVCSHASYQAASPGYDACGSHACFYPSFGFDHCLGKQVEEWLKALCKEAHQLIMQKI